MIFEHLVGHEPLRPPRSQRQPRWVESLNNIYPGLEALLAEEDSTEFCH